VFGGVGFGAEDDDVAGDGDGVEEPEEGLVFVGRQVVANEGFDELSGHGWVPLVGGLDGVERGKNGFRKVFPADRKDFPVDRKDVPVNRKGFPDDRKGFPVNGKDVPVDRKGFPIDGKALPVRRKGFSNDRTAFPIGEICHSTTGVDRRMGNETAKIQPEN
jgi:hypothetical protein